MQGLGIYEWLLETSFEGDPELILGELLRLGAARFEVKHYDYNFRHEGVFPGNQYYPNQEPILRALSPRLRSNNIELWGWTYTRFHNKPEYEAEQAARAAQSIDAFGLIVNAEVDWKWEIGNHSDQVAKETYTFKYMAALRKFWGGPIALSSYRFPKLHQDFPWKSVAPFCDYMAPQVYFLGAHNPRAQLIRCVNEYAEITDVPVLPTWPTFKWGQWSPLPSDMQEAQVATKELNLLGESFYRMGTGMVQTPEAWKAIHPRGEPAPPEPPSPSTDEKVTVTLRKETIKEIHEETGKVL